MKEKFPKDTIFVNEEELSNKDDKDKDDKK